MTIDQALERLPDSLDAAKEALGQIARSGFRPRVVNQIDLKLDEARMWFEELTRA